MIDCLEKSSTSVGSTRARLAAAGMLLEQRESPLFGDISLARQVLERLASKRLLAPTDDTSVLVLDKIGLLESAGRVVCGSVPNLCL